MSFPDKLEAVVGWQQPSTRKQLQQFLGFANFYRRFIRDYSKVAAPLTQLTSTHFPFSWTPVADSAFHHLSNLFSSTPVLIYPDLQLQFIVEVDASSTGIGVVLSQKSPKDQKVHLCAFFLQKVDPGLEKLRRWQPEAVGIGGRTTGVQTLARGLGVAVPGAH